MLNQERHRTTMYQIIKDLFATNRSHDIAFKGGTLCYFMYQLDRFSTDIDIDCLGGLPTEAQTKDIIHILTSYGIIKEKQYFQNMHRYILSYGPNEDNIKIEFNARVRKANTYEIVSFFGQPIKVMTKSSIFANKLVACMDRDNPTSRDIRDIHFFFVNQFPIHDAIIQERKGLSKREFFQTLIIFISEKFVSSKIVDANLGKVLTPQQKDRAKKHLIHTIIGYINTSILDQRKPVTLTKSLFIDFMDYPKLARRKANNLAVYKKIRKIETEEVEDHIMAIGQAVEDVVKQLLETRYQQQALDLMPRFHKLISDDTDDDDEVLIKAELDLPKSLSDTLQAIKDQVRILYQPTFQYGDCLVRADFMVRNGTTYDLIEVKAKSGIRKDVTDDGEKKPIGSIESKFLHDLSFQNYVINKSLAHHDLPLLGHSYVAYLNKEYIKQGPLDLLSLITQDLAGTTKEIEVIQRNKPTMIKVDDSLLSDTIVEEKCEQMRTYLTLSEDEANKQFLRAGTRYLEYFGEDKPFGTVMGMGIHHSNASYIQDLFYQGRTNISELTEDEIEGFNDTAQNFITTYLRCKETHQPLIDRSKIAEIFDGFKYPICFYDYETISVPVPIMDITRPYMQTIVQYSLHKYYEDGTMQHYGGVFVGAGDATRREITIPDNPNAVDYECEQVITGSYKDLLQQMLADIGTDLQTSTFIVWHESFENSRNKEVAILFPDLADSFLTINANTYDLKKIVSQGYYVDPACKGSASIKKVLPVLVPEMSYDTMEIGRGDIAMRRLYDLIVDTVPSQDRDALIRHLLLYCGQDTLAMVRIFEALKKLI